MHNDRGLQGNLAEECELVQLLFGGDHDKFKEQFEKNVRGSILHRFLSKKAKRAFFFHFFYSIVALPRIKFAEGNEVEITAYRVGIDKISFKFGKDGKDLVKTIEITYDNSICPSIEVSDSVGSGEDWLSPTSKKDDASAEEVPENNKDDAFAGEVPENNEEHSFEALLEQISKKRDVDHNVLDVLAMVNKLSESFNINKEIPDHDQEAAQQGFVFGFLILHYKRKHRIDCKIEHSAGKGRSDLIFALNNGMGDAVPVLVEFKAGNNYLYKGTNQIKEQGYLCNLDVIMKTKSRYAIIVGANLTHGEPKVEVVKIIRPKNIISEILKICASQDDCDSKGDNIKGLLEPLYYSIPNVGIGNDCSMSRLFAGQLLLGNEEHDKQKIEKSFFVRVHSDGNATFILKKPREEGSVIINFVEAVGRETRSGSSSKNISLPSFLENYVKFPVNKIDVVVDQAMIKFQDRFVVKFNSACHTEKGPSKEIINLVKKFDVSNLITGYSSQFMRELVDVLDSIHTRINW